MGSRQILDARVPASGKVADAVTGLARKRPIVILLIVALLAMLPGFFTIPVVDRDEARFSQATRQMLESGDYVTPRLGDETRFKKPVGIYWLQAATAHLTGQTPDAPIWVLRLPSLLAALFSTLLVWRMGSRLFNPDAGLIAALLLAVSPVFDMEARLAKTDSVQLLCALVAQYALMEAWFGRARRWATPLMFWGALGAAILIKGPIVVLLAMLTALALVLWSRKLGWLMALRPFVGVPFMLLIALPWFALIAWQHGADFFEESVGKDMLGKVATGQESHGALPGTHLLTSFFFYWPGVFVVLMALPWIRANIARPEVRFCLAWLVPFWIVFELIVTKLPHYTLPAVPAAFLLAGAALSQDLPGLGLRWRQVIASLAVVPGLVLAIGLPITYAVVMKAPPPLLALALAALALAFAAAAILAIVAGAMKSAAIRLVGLAATVSIVAFGLLIPGLKPVWVAPAVAQAVRAVTACDKPQIMVAGMGEASMLFYLGARTAFGSGAAAADFLQQPGCRVAVVEAAQRAAFDERIVSLSVTPPRVAQLVEGLNIANTKKVTLAVLTSDTP